MGRTKKVGIAGKYGPRYGKGVKKRLLKLDLGKKHKCPACLKLTLKRKASGIWECKHCKLKIAGRAYKL